MNKQGFVDFHCHTTRSDGKYRPLELVRMAKAAGIKVLAITDHNILSPDLDELMIEVGGDIQLIRGCEMSCNYQISVDKKVELHIVVLNYDKDALALAKIVEQNNRTNRREYIEKVLHKLYECGVVLGDYEYFCRKYKDTTHIGRMTIASEMVKRGYAQNIDDAFDTYIGQHGKKLAYVPNPIQYASLEDTLKAALADHGIPCLAHLFYYNSLTPEEQEKLLADFKKLSGRAGAMEVEYARYSMEQREVLRNFAKKYDLSISCGSDFHGQDVDETLEHHFPIEIYEDFMVHYHKVFSELQSNAEKYKL